MTPQAQKIEALLLTAAEAVEIKELAELIGEPIDVINGHLEEIKQALTEHGLTLITTDQYAQLTTSPLVSDFLATYNRDSQKPLSKAAAEALSIVAYRGPIARHEIDTLRGVDSRAALRQLHRRGLIIQTQTAGGATIFDISIDFLSQLGIAEREQLPNFSELNNHERVSQLISESK